MIDAIDEIGRFLAGKSENDLASDRLLLFGVVRALEVLGEAATGVSEDTRLRSPTIPWALIVATRNRLIHGYFDIDHEIVWQTACAEAPALLPELDRLLNLI